MQHSNTARFSLYGFGLSSYSVMCSLWQPLSVIEIPVKPSCLQRTIPFTLKGPSVPQDGQTLVKSWEQSLAAFALACARAHCIFKFSVYIAYSYCSAWVHVHKAASWLHWLLLLLACMWVAASMIIATSSVQEPPPPSRHGVNSEASAHWCFWLCEW